MVDVGSVKIKAEIDTSQTERGIVGLNLKLEELKNKGKSVSSDFHRLSVTSNKLKKTLMGLGLAGLGAMAVLAKDSPAVAGEMAKMDVEMGKLSRTAGTILEPAFQAAAKGLSSLNNFLSDHKTELKAATQAAVNFASAMWDVAAALVGAFTAKSMYNQPFGNTPFTEGEVLNHNINSTPEGTPIGSIQLPIAGVAQSDIKGNPDPLGAVISAFMMWLNGNTSDKTIQDSLVLGEGNGTS